MAAFLEAHFIIRANPENPAWIDRSTPEEFIFESDFGLVCLRRRQFYPQTFAFTEGSKLYFGYGDSHAGRAIRQQPLRGVAAEDFFGQDFLYIEADASRHHVLIQRDAMNTLPLFVGQSGASFSVSNQFGRVASALASGGPALHADLLGIAEAIMGEDHYGRTLIAEIQTLEDRVRAEWSTKGLSIMEPADNPFLAQLYADAPSNPREFVGRLEATIEDYARRYFGGGPVACELSGGFDSTLLAGYLADSGREVVATTLQYPRQFGESLAAKLADFAQRFKVTHHTVPMDFINHAPMASQLRTGFTEPFYHREELYSASIDEMLRYLASLGAPAVIRGMGGDELCQNLPPHRAVEQGQDAIARRRSAAIPEFMTTQFKTAYHHLLGAQPAIRKKAIPLAAYSVVSGNISGNNQYIESGIWPVSPLTDVALFRYCQGLPIQYRLNKNIMRAYLEARRFPKSLATGTKKQQEHFGDFFDLSVAHAYGPAIDHFMTNSVLARHGLLDAERLRGEYHAAAERVRASTEYKEEPIFFHAFSVLMSEVGLQSLGIQTL